MKFDQVFRFELPPASETPREAASPQHRRGPAIDRLEEEAEDGPDKQILFESVQTEPLKRNAFFEKPSNEEAADMEFKSMHLSKPLLKACADLHYSKATPIQAAAIPLVLSGRDICGSAITGSGKTAAFVLPLLERLTHRPKGVSTTYVLIIAPTRELSAQIHEVIVKLAKFTDIRAALTVGGFSLQVQAATLDTRPEIVVGTPGRLIDHLRNSRSFDLDDVHALVLDEADKLLKMGFINEITEILRYLPENRQTMLFSATMTEEVKRLMQLSLNKPVRIAADPAGRVPCTLTQEIVRLKGEEMRKQKETILCALCSRTFASGRCIIFCSTKRRAHRIKLIFDMLKLPRTGELHSNMSQSSRLESLEKFRNKDYAYLVATDVAGRGLDIIGVEVVVNYDAPSSLDTYLHRIGRTARAGAEGRAITFITDTNRPLLKEILSSTEQKLINRIIPSEAIAYYQQQLQLHQRHLKLVENNEIETEKLNQAEMELDRARNKIEYEKEILARPQRTWFQSNKERKEMQKLARLEDVGMLNAEDLHSSSTVKGKKKTNKHKEQMQQAPVMLETKSVKGTVRAIKRQQRLYEQQGSNSKTAHRRARESIISSKRRQAADVEEGYLEDPQSVKRQKRKALEYSAEMLDTNTTTGSTHVYAGGAKSGKIVARKLSKKAINLIKRKGKGKHAFKGKKKFKRR